MNVLICTMCRRISGLALLHRLNLFPRHTAGFIGLSAICSSNVSTGFCWTPLKPGAPLALNLHVFTLWGWILVLLISCLNDRTAPGSVLIIKELETTSAFVLFWFLVFYMIMSWLTFSDQTFNLRNRHGDGLKQSISNFHPKRKQLCSSAWLMWQHYTVSL